MRPIDLLRDLAEDDRARGVGEIRQLAQVVVDDAAGAGPLERRADEQRALDWRRDDDGCAGYVRLLVGDSSIVPTRYLPMPVVVNRPVAV
jgi:hypothetical protein